MMMVEPDVDRVEARLRRGEYACSACGEGRLRPGGSPGDEGTGLVGELNRPGFRGDFSALILHATAA